MSIPGWEDTNRLQTALERIDTLRAVRDALSERLERLTKRTNKQAKRIATDTGRAAVGSGE